MSRVGMVLDGKYEILKQIGQGGMSIVYLAIDTRLNKQWAVKEMKNNMGNKEDVISKGLQMEANVLKMVDHPVLPRIVDIIEYDGTVFVVMDYIEGKTLDEVLQVEGAQQQECVIQWAKELCSALIYLHSMNPPIIYRDMKPSNIMLKPDGRIKLIDFGTAKKLEVENIADTTALGTRGYAAPEQFGDESGRGIYKTDARTDIYSLGATLYHMVTGRSPSAPPYIMKPIRFWDSSLSSGLEKIIYKCTMQNPNERYQDCVELLKDLENYQKLDDAYRKKCLQKMKGFLITFVFAVCSAIVSVAGYIGKEKERRNNYDSLIQMGFEHTVNGNYEEAAKVYIDAITKVDGRKSAAYIELLDLYRNYMGEPMEGLGKVTYYIDQQYEDVHENQEVLLRVAMDYFDVLQDYKTSAYYFGLIDENAYPEAKYYKEIATSMVKLNIDYESMLTNIERFESINDETRLSLQKLMNYRLLCIVYARNLEQMQQAAKGIVRVADKGLKVLELYEDDSVKAEYYIIYNQYLSLAYERLGEKSLEEDEELAREYYEKALECCDFMLGMISGTESNTIERITDYQLREAKYCQKASIYEALGMYKEACKVYEKAEKEYGKNSIDIYVGHLSLLCNIEERYTTDIENWDATRLLKLYEEGCKVQGIEKDYRWKQLVQRITPLFEGTEG